MEKTKKKNMKKIIALVCVVLAVVLLAALPLLTRKPDLADGPQASILSGTVEAGSIETVLIGGGSLTEPDAVTISIPTGVKLSQFAVKNGAAVSQGDVIAYVDPVTTLTAIAEVQETLDSLAAQIEAASGQQTNSSIIAYAGGTVKIVYAQEGDSVQDVMLEHGALAVLSLDNLMAVKLEVDCNLSAGDTVTVTLSDDTAVTGTVKTNLSGQLIVTVEDQDYTPGQSATVSVTDSDGEEEILGADKLYILNAWNASAYSGTVSAVSIQVGDTVTPGQTVITLTDTGTTATWQQLVAQRQEYEDLLQELLMLYQTRQITAPCDGIVSGIDADSAQLVENSSTETTTENNSTSDLMGNMGSFPQSGMTQGGMTQPGQQELYDLSYAQIASVTDQKILTVSVSVDELDILSLEVGQAAQITVDALAGKSFEATITDIGNNGTSNGGNSKFTVTLELERAEDMLTGMSATATVTLQTTDAATTVPVAALVEEGTQTILYTGYDEESGELTDPVEVTVGVSDGETAQILSGLEAGQSYYYAYYDTLYISNTPQMSGGNLFGR